MRRSLRVAARFRALLPAAGALLTLCGCGYIGEPVPPSLNLAAPIQDLRAVEYGDRLLIDFTIPALTTDGIALKKVRGVDVRIGVAGNPFDAGRWSLEAKQVAVAKADPGAAHAEVQASEWMGKDIVVGVRIVNTRGRASDWSNFIPLHVVPPVARPAAVVAEPDRDGVKVSFAGAAGKFRIYRQAPGEEAPSLIGSADEARYIDTTAQYGKTYSYLVQALDGAAESEVTAAVSVTHRDVAPPGAPAALNAVAGVGAIELVWDRNTEPDLRGYRVYRAAEGGEFAVVAEFVDSPAYSDRQLEAGKKYRYAVTAIDTAGNESGRSGTVEVTAP